jgi:hypothetical protein
VKSWVFPYGIWYATTVALALGAAAGAVSGDVPGAVLDGALAAVVGVILVRSRVRWSRSGEKAARAEMMRLVDERAGSGPAGWLHRDAHLLFNTERRRVCGMGERMLLVIDEEQVRDVEDMRDAGGGKVAVTGVSYRAHPVFARVLRHADGTAVMVTADDIEMAGLPAGRASRRCARRRGYAGMIRTIRAGLLFADAGELAGVVAQFRDAEPISRADTEGPEEWEPAS